MKLMQSTPTDRDLEILRHVARYRLSTRELLQQLFFPDATPSAVYKVVARLEKSKLLRECRLSVGFSYYILGRRAADYLPAEPKSRQRFTEQSFPLAYAYASFCVAHNLRRLTSAEFSRCFPELCEPGKPTGIYYVDDRRQPSRIGTVLLDRGNSPRNIVRKLQRLMRQRYKTPAFASLIQNGWFCVTILTCWPLKQEYLQSVVQQSIRSPISIDIVTVSELEQFYRKV